MSRFRKKPIIIEAEQFIGESLYGYEVSENQLVIPTLEGIMRADICDWIITGINGERYPCKPDIFEKTYELVE